MDILRLLQVAAKYVGQQETDGNSGFVSKEFQDKMVATGWQPYHSWCCYFCELVAKEAAGAGTEEWMRFDKLFQPSCTATYANFAGSEYYRVGRVPRPGSLIVWRYGQGWRGHIGIVESARDKIINTIEGNTNKSGSREGTHVLRKQRKLEFTDHIGLNLIGFIYLV